MKPSQKGPLTISFLSKHSVPLCANLNSEFTLCLKRGLQMVRA